MEKTDLEVMSSTAKKYINDHNNPLVKLELGGTKYFLRSNKDEVEAAIEKSLSTIENAIKHDRVDRRCARAKGIWLSDQKLAKITKIVGFLAHYGYQDKNGKFLYPEEALFLLETNRLELTHNGIPVSIQEGFRDMLSEEACNFHRYSVYKKLTLQGYILSRRNFKKDNKTIETLTVGRKRLLPNVDEGSVSSKITKLSFDYGDIFEKLREKGPEQCMSDNSKKDSDYFVTLPTNSSKNLRDFSLTIGGSNFESSSFSTRNVTNIHATCSDNNVAFHKFVIVDLPNL